MGSYLENVLENSESLRQDIYRYGLWLVASGQATRNWWIDANYRLLDYSDSNMLNSFDLRNSFLITRPPRQLFIHLDYSFANTNQSTIFNPVTGLFNATHPYFSPRSFSQVTLYAEWKHWLTRDLFIGADQLWYSLRYGVSFDSQSEFYNLWGAELRHDIRPWFSLGLRADMLRSGSYDLSTAMGQVIIRFP